MAVRIVSAIIGVGLFLAACFAGLLPFTFAVIVIASIAGAEFVRAEIAAPPPTTVPMWAQPIARIMRHINPFIVSLGLFLPPMALQISLHGRVEVCRAFIVFASIGVLFGLGLVAKAWSTGELLGWFRAFYGKVGFWYVGPLFSSFVLIRGLPGRIRVGNFAEADRGAWLILFVAVCVWSTDSVAYFAGRALGKHKLCPKLSPKKTLEGFIGGLVGAIVAGALFGHWIGLPVGHGAVVGAIAGLVGPMGDLFESGLKREINIKDFGSVMPGHGGALDRFDSLMFVAPLAYLYLVLVIR